MTRRYAALVLAFISAQCGYAGILPAFAQSAAQSASDASLVIGTVRESDLVPNAAGTGWKTGEFALTLQPEASIRIDLESNDFDPTLRVYEIRNGRRFDIAENDDFGDSLSSRIRFTSANGGDFVIAVDAVFMLDEKAGRARFRLSVANEERRALPPPKPLDMTESMTGTFAESDEADDDAGLVQRYAFRAEAGQRIVLDIAALPSVKIGSESPSLPKLELHRADQPGIELELPAKRRTATAARAMTILPGTGDYILVVRQSERRPGASYRLGAKLWSVAPQTARALRVGETKAGEFTFADPQTNGDFGEDPQRLYQEWSLPVRRGQALRLELCGADSLDAMIQLLGSTAIGDRLLAQADDLPGDQVASCGPARRNSVLDLTIRDNGVLRVLVSPLRDVGPYTLVVREREVPLASAAPGR